MDSDIKTLKEFQKSFPDGHVLDDGPTTWMSNYGAASGDGGLWVAATGEADAAIPCSKELFSFGSGTWEQGKDAEELMLDLERGWISLKCDHSTPVILENHTTLPEYLKSIAWVKSGAITTLDDVFNALETNGISDLIMTGHKVTRGVPHHKVDQDEIIVFKMSNKACFCEVEHSARIVASIGSHLLCVNLSSTHFRISGLRTRHWHILCPQHRHQYNMLSSL
jgi:hypothetical protein